MNVVVNKVIGNGLRQIRRQHGLTQSEVARRLNVTQPLISKIESGERNLLFYDIFPYARALDTTPEGLYLSIRSTLLANSEARQTLEQFIADDKGTASDNAGGSPSRHR